MKNTSAVAALVGVSMLLAGCHHDNPPSPNGAPSPMPVPPVVTNPMPVPSPSSTTPRAKVVIYTVDVTHGTDSSNYLVPKTVTLTNPRDPAREAMNRLIADPNGPIPVATKVRAIKIEDGLATVDFSRPPVDETHGEEKQAQALEAIQRTLGQFSDIERIQITVNGQAPESLGEAAGGPMDVVRPDAKPQEAGGA